MDTKRTSDLVPIYGLYRRLKSTGIGLSWLKQEADAGRLPFLMVGKRRLFNVAAIEAILLERAGKGGGE
ncbi:MAG: hypothetical protein IT443_07420 [Phycisphaeraceae bacterium]|nr:hypothetical protein [Phycisphaeraceae bacterium]